MQNSFKQSYDKNVNPDGSVELRFKSGRWGSHAASAAGMAFMFLVLPASCAITYPVVGASSSKNLSLAWPVVAVLLAFIILFFIHRRPTTIIVKPGEGLLFDGKSIPFADIKSIGTRIETTARDPKGSAYIYVESLGNSIRISGHTKQELANAVRDEILNASGLTWN